MLWNRIVLVATIFVVSMSFSVSNRAPALTQSVNVPSEEGHSLRSLRSSGDAGAGASTELVSSPGRTLDDTLDETSDNTPDDTLDEIPREIPHADEEREAFHYLTGGLLQLRRISDTLSFEALIRLMRLKTYYDAFRTKRQKSQALLSSLVNWYKETFEGPFDKVFSYWVKKKGYSHKKVFNALKITPKSSWQNEFKYLLYERYCQATHVGTADMNAPPFQRMDFHAFDPLSPRVHGDAYPQWSHPEPPPGVLSHLNPQPPVAPLGVREQLRAPYLDHPSPFKTHDHVEPPIVYPVVEPVRGPV